jgi:hypothetical protein
MARLPVPDKVALGEYLIKAATEPETRAELLADPTKVLAKFVTYPQEVDAQGNPIQHRIVVHEDTKHVTHIVLPTQEEVRVAVDQTKDQKTGMEGMFPAELVYTDDKDDKKDPLRALKFRFGEYTFARCKH